MSKEGKDTSFTKIISNGARAGSADAYVSKTKANYTDIGVVTLTGQQWYGPQHRRAEIEMKLLKEYRGKCYGRTALDWVTRWAFHRAGMHRVAIAAFSFNEPAFDWYQSMKFVLEAGRRDAAWYDGKFQDTIELAILEDEWREREKKRQK